MSRLLGKMVMLAFFLLCASTAAGQGTKCDNGTCTLDEKELHAIVQRAYQLGYKEGYKEGAKQRQIIRIAPSGSGDVSTETLQPPVRYIVPGGEGQTLLPSLPGVSTGQ